MIALCVPAIAPSASSASESFHAAAGVTGFLHGAAPDAAPAAAVVIVHDTLGMDARSHRYIAQLTGAGLLVLEVELGANPPDGHAPPLPDDEDAALLVLRAAAGLARDRRVDPARIGAIGFGIGARAVALARRQGADPFAARVLLYPGCASLADRFVATARPPLIPPALLLHGEDDAANPAIACERLAAMLGTMGPIRRVGYRDAGYGWDLPLVGEGRQAHQPWPREARWLPATSWPELAELSAAQAAAFLAATLRAVTAGHAACPDRYCAAADRPIGPAAPRQR